MNKMKFKLYISISIYIYLIIYVYVTNIIFCLTIIKLNFGNCPICD